VQDYITALAAKDQRWYKTDKVDMPYLKTGDNVPKSQVGGPENAHKLWEDIKGVVVKSLIATLPRTTAMEAAKVTKGTTYEIFGYDIVLDDELNPYLCEINETPNMGLEVNYHEDYNGLGEKIEKDDFMYKTKLMDATLSVADVEPRWSISELDVLKNEIVNVVVDNSLGCWTMTETKDKEDAECLNQDDLEVLVKLESELKRSDGNEYDQVFPCVECEKYFVLMKKAGLEWNNVLDVWWIRQRETLRWQNNMSNRWSKSATPTLETWIKFLMKHVENE
jgi:hypothetical protein